MKAKVGIPVFLFFLTLSSLFSMVFCQEINWTTTYKIVARIDGSAIWIIEQRTFLETVYDEATFNYYASLEYHDKLSKNISALVDEVSFKTGRWNMTVVPPKTEFSIFRTATGSYGVIKHQYDWIGFAEVEGTRIQMVDVFMEILFLFGDGTLIIEYPLGYEVVDVFPIPDESRETDRILKWNGTKNFSEEHPKLVLEKKTLTVIDILRDNILFISVSAIIGIGSISLWFLRFRKAKKAQIISPVPYEIESEEEKVVRHLEAAGGRLYQSTIAKQCGFSRTKTSVLLTSMEKRGIVTRQKKGRERLVMLHKRKT